MAKSKSTSAKSSTSTNGSTFFFSPLPSPVSPTSLSMETPSLGSSDILPRPKRGAPPVVYTPKKKQAVVEGTNQEGDAQPAAPPAPLDPALCEEW